MKKCLTCKIEKPFEEFPPNKKNKDGLNTKCRNCYNEYMRGWYEKNTDKHKERVTRARDAHLERANKYGLTPDELTSMLQANGGLCYACNVRPIQVIDHCHETNLIRGALCSYCNRGIGFLGDNIDGVKKALDYLQQAVVSPHSYKVSEG